MIACLLYATPAFSQVAQSTTEDNLDILFNDVPIPVLQPCSKTRIHIYIRSLNLPSHLALNKAAYQMLVSKCQKAAVPVLIDALRDQQENIRANAALAIGQIGTEASTASPALIEALGDKSSIVQINAAYALGQMGWMAEAALPALSDRLKDEDRAVIASAANAIGQIGSSLLNQRYFELYGAVTESNSHRSVTLSKEGLARQTTLRNELYEKLFDALNTLYIARTGDRAAWDKDINAESALLSIIDAIDALDLIYYLYVDLGLDVYLRQWSWATGGIELVATAQSHLGRNRPAICRIRWLNRVIPRCRKLT